MCWDSSGGDRRGDITSAGSLMAEHGGLIAFNQHREDSEPLSLRAGIERHSFDQRTTMHEEHEFDTPPAGPASRMEKAIFGYLIFIALVAATVSFAAVSFAISP